MTFQQKASLRILIAFSAMALLIFIAGCQSGATPDQAAQQSTPAPSDRAIFAEGRVVPLAETTLAFPVEGQIAAILVSEGDAVAAGEPLVQLLATEQQAALAAAEAGVSQAEANVAAAEADVAAAQAGVEVAQEAVAVAAAARAALVAPPSSERLQVAESAVDAAAAGIAEAAGERDQAVGNATAAEIAAAEARLKAAETNLFVVRMQNQPIVQDPQQSADAREQAQLRLNAATAELNAAQAALDRLQSGATAAERQAASSGVGSAAAQRDAAAAERDLLEAGAPPAAVAVADAQIASAENRVEAAETQRTLATTAVARAEAELAAAEAARDLAASALEQTTLEAPFTGAVAAVHVSEGEALTAGQPALTLADFSAWQVETTDLTELQVGELEPGSPVAVVVDALPGERLQGEVLSIAPTAEIVRGDVTYRATVALEGTAALPLRWGMTAFIAPAAAADSLPAPATAAETLAVAASVAPDRDALLGFARGGTVAAIYVAEGDRVAAGDPLLALEADALQGALRQAQANLAAAEAAYEAARDGIADAETAVTVAEGEALVAEARRDQVIAGPLPEEIAAAESRLAAAQSALGGAAGARDALLQEPGMATRVEAARADVASATAELRRLEEQYQQIIDTCYETPEGEVCPLYGPVEETTRAQVEAARAQVAAAEAALTQLQSGPTTAQQQAASGRVSAAAANRDLAAAQLALLQAGATEEQIQQAEAALALAQAEVTVAQAAVARAEATAAQAEAGVAAAEASVARAEAALAQATLHAPFAGVVAALDVNPGELVGSGRPVLTLAAAPWIVETTELTELDVAGIESGDDVRVRFDALPGVEVAGRVERIALTAQNRNGDVVYTSRIQLDDAADLPLRWGMSAEVDFMD